MNLVHLTEKRSYYFFVLSPFPKGYNVLSIFKEVMMNKQLTRSITDRKIAGVCGGVAEYFGIDSNLVRILWVLFALGGGSGLLIYIICALLIPEEPTW